jgi:hypothetical protein
MCDDKPKRLGEALRDRGRSAAGERCQLLKRMLVCEVGAELARRQMLLQTAEPQRNFLNPAWLFERVGDFGASF